jgi:hypothetical protein
VAVLKIPEPYRPGVSVLANLPESSYKAILEALSRSPSSFTRNRELVAWIASEVKDTPALDLAKLVDTLTSLYRLRLRRPGTSIQTLADDVTVAARDIPNFKVPEGVAFTERLAALLALNSLNTIALKAKELQLESERTFCEARIITDVRPVFGENVDDSPSMIIVHTLKLGFHESGHKDIYVALDAADIASLKKTLERAEDKARKLKALLDATGIRSIDLS